MRGARLIGHCKQLLGCGTHVLRWIGARGLSPRDEACCRNGERQGENEMQLRDPHISIKPQLAASVAVFFMEWKPIDNILERSR